MQVRPYQFESLKKCSGHVEESCGNKGETSNTGEYNECYLETQLSFCYFFRKLFYFMSLIAEYH